MKGKRVPIFLSESDKWQHRPLSLGFRNAKFFKSFSRRFTHLRELAREGFEARWFKSSLHNPKILFFQ